MAVDLPFNMFLTFIALDTIMGVLGLALASKKIAGSPFITLFAGILMFAFIAVTPPIDTSYADAQPSNTTQSGGVLTCVTTTNTVCTPTAITKSFSYYNSTGQLTSKPNPIPITYDVKQENQWLYFILIGAFWIIMATLVQFSKW